MSEMLECWDRDPSKFVVTTVTVLAGLMCSLYYAQNIPFLWNPVCFIVSLLGGMWMYLSARFAVWCARKRKQK